MIDNNLEINHNSKQVTEGTGHQPCNEVSHKSNTGCQSNKYTATFLALITLI